MNENFNQCRMFGNDAIQKALNCFGKCKVLLCYFWCFDLFKLLCYCEKRIRSLVRVHRYTSSFRTTQTWNDSLLQHVSILSEFHPPKWDREESHLHFIKRWHPTSFICFIFSIVGHNLALYTLFFSPVLEAAGSQVLSSDPFKLWQVGLQTFDTSVYAPYLHNLLLIQWMLWLMEGQLERILTLLAQTNHKVIILLSGWMWLEFRQWDFGTY